MKFEHSIADYSELLNELTKKVLAKAELKEDLIAAKKLFTADGSLDHANVTAFNEWYLLERECPPLGAPPAVAFADSKIVEKDLWHCLLDSFFGLFQVTEKNDADNSAILECLWSARQVRVCTLPAGIEVGTLIPARAAQSDSESHLLLPAANFIFAPGLLESIAHDLREIRGAQPRSRLSQLEWQRLWEDHQLSQATAGKDSLEDNIAQIISGQDKVSLEQILEMLDKGGVQQTLDALAFDSDLDLEALRSAFSLHTNDGDEDLSDAISEFLNADSSGANLDQAFSDLEKQLELEDGATSILSEDNEATGVDDFPGVEMWLRSYLFDCQVNELTISDNDGKEIEKFLNYCADTIKGDEIDPHQLASSTVLAYMMGAEDLDDLQRKISALDDFLSWLHEEQDAPFDEILPLAGSATKDWLQQLILCNQSLQANNVVGNSLVDVSALAPLATKDEHGANVSILGFPSDYQSAVKVGDKLMGAWKDGSFVVAAWMPQRLLPQKQ